MRADHPLESDLALYSGDDLGVWQQWRIRRHLSSCSSCRQEVKAYRDGLAAIHEAAETEMPGHSNWPRLSQEMTGNIRVGFAAGECIAGFEKSIRPPAQRLMWHTGMVLAGVMILAVSSLWLRLSSEERSQLASNLGHIRWERMFRPLRPPSLGQDAVVLEAGPTEIEVKAANGAALKMMHPHSDGGTVSMNMQDSAGVRYVDADSGQVTTNRVYYAQ
jgi:hypothetical protein